MKDGNRANWISVLGRHSAAVAQYVALASQLDAASWNRPVAEGKWTPSAITQHLIKTYELLLAEVRGGAGIRMRSGWWLRQLLRATVLQYIFRSRRLPRAKAPSEVVPAGPAEEPVQALERFTRLAQLVEAELTARRGDKGLRLSHHVFGPIEPLKGIDFIAIHIEHHGRQLPGAAGVSESGTPPV